MINANLFIYFNRPSKRKLVSATDKNEKQKKQKIDDIAAAEELALHFLNN